MLNQEENKETNSIPLKNSQNPNRPINFNHILIRSTIIILFFSIIAYFNIFHKGRGITLAPKQCYNDQSFNSTASIHKYFQDNVKARNAFLISGALMIDILLFSSLFFWIFHFNDWVLAYTMILFYGIRGTLVFVNFIFFIF